MNPVEQEYSLKRVKQAARKGRESCRAGTLAEASLARLKPLRTA